MKLKPIDEVMKELVESLSDRKLSEFILNELTEMNQKLKLNTLMEANMKDIQRLSKPALQCIPCSERPKVPGPQSPPRACMHMEPAWAVWRRKYNIPSDNQVG